MLAASLEAQVLASDSSALARDCRREMKAANARLLKLGRKVHIHNRCLCPGTSCTCCERMAGMQWRQAGMVHTCQSVPRPCRYHVVLQQQQEL